MEATAKAAMAAVLLLLLLDLAVESGASDSGPAYTNHTVGGTAGWFFNNTPSADYSAWAANQTFNLGDYLIFNTNTNHTVLQTYNKTTYDACSADEDFGNETTVYTAGITVGVPVTIAVPLTIEGKQYYFSDADDGNECDKGMRFAIEVEHGRGLPPSLSQPPPPPYEEPPPSPDQSETSPKATTTTTQNEAFYRGGSEKLVPGRGAAALVLLFSGLGFLLSR